MAFNTAAMQAAANALRTACAYGQLHSGAAGDGTDNVTTADREAITWTAADSDGSFGLSAALDFTGGAAAGPVYSVTLWSAATNGTFYGEFPLTGDTAFNAAGNYSVTAIDVTGSVTDLGS